MKGPDCKLRTCHPVLFSVAMDYPEACLFIQVRSGRECPVCIVTDNDFDDLSRGFEFQNHSSMPRTISGLMLHDENSTVIDSHKIGSVDKKVSE